MAVFEMEEAIKDVDVLVNAQDLFISNLTGHPSVVLPRTIRERDGKYSPVSDLFTGHLYQEEKLLALSQAYQGIVDGHLQTPPLDKLHKELEEAEAQQRDETEKSDSQNTENENVGDG